MIACSRRSHRARNVRDSRNEISLSELKLAGSLFVAADTWLGPLHFAYGRATGDHQAFYVFLGRP